MQLTLKALFGVAFCALCTAWAPAHAQDANEQRLALLIGNASYRNAPLSNPVNDVRLMETVLKQAGFVVIKAENASLRDTRRLVRDFGDRLKQRGGVGLFYFAGHGVQVRGENYLVSIDSDIRNEDEVAEDALNAQLVLEKMQSAGNRMNLVILDACRNNPFAVRNRSSTAGLATMSAPSGSMVAYSTSPGSVASDGNGQNGLYTQHLASVLAQPGLPVEEVFKQVRTLVRRDSKGQQTPWENTALEGQFYFNPTPISVVAFNSSGRSDASDAVRLELGLWETVKNSGSVGELQSYLLRYPQGAFAPVAQSRLAALQTTSAVNKVASAVGASPVASGPPPTQVAPPPVLVAAVRPTAAPAPLPATAVPAATIPAKKVAEQEFLAGTTRLVGRFVSDPDSRAWSGTGKMIWDNGDVFEGTLLAGKRQGLGKFTWHDGQYSGDWLDDKAVGKGAIAFKNGDEYTGAVVNGVPEGEGVMKFASGDVYRGTFAKSQASGVGIYQWKNGQSYEGFWLQDQPHGKGKLRYANGNVYDGELQAGAPHGTGQLQYVQGDSYQGQFVKGDSDGQGVFIWKSGDRYSGQWKAGLKHGSGVFVWSTGDRWEGVYQNDQQSANGKLIRRIP
jgi:hypothetical protein